MKKLGLALILFSSVVAWALPPNPDAVYLGRKCIGHVLYDAFGEAWGIQYVSLNASC